VTTIASITRSMACVAVRAPDNKAQVTKAMQTMTPNQKALSMSASATPRCGRKYPRSCSH
jgi:hypothetical protein